MLPEFPLGKGVKLCEPIKPRLHTCLVLDLGPSPCLLLLRGSNGFRANLGLRPPTCEPIKPRPAGKMRSKPRKSGGFYGGAEGASPGQAPWIPSQTIFQLLLPNSGVVAAKKWLYLKIQVAVTPPQPPGCDVKPLLEQEANTRKKADRFSQREPSTSGLEEPPHKQTWVRTEF